MSGRPDDPRIYNRQIRFYWLLDTSGSMAEDNAIGAAEEVLRSNVDVTRSAMVRGYVRGELLIYAIRFADDAGWVNAALADGVTAESYTWDAHLEARGKSNVGPAITLLVDHLRAMPANAFRPTIVLVTDGGLATDDLDAALGRLRADAWGRHAVRLAIAVGDAADKSSEGYQVCKKFCSSEVKPITYPDAAGLAHWIRTPSGGPATSVPQPRQSDVDTVQTSDDGPSAELIPIRPWFHLLIGASNSMTMGGKPALVDAAVRRLAGEFNAAPPAGDGDLRCARLHVVQFADEARRVDLRRGDMAEWRHLRWRESLIRYGGRANVLEAYQSLDSELRGRPADGPAVVVLIADGHFTGDVRRAEALSRSGAAGDALRLCIAVGDDADLTACAVLLARRSSIPPERDRADLARCVRSAFQTQS